MGEADAGEPREPEPAKQLRTAGCSCEIKQSTTPPRFTLLTFALAALAQARYSILRMAWNASCGISTLPTFFMRFLPSFCFSRSLRLREMSPP
jgi:hypothetical protein